VVLLAACSSSGAPPADAGSQPGRPGERADGQVADARLMLEAAADGLSPPTLDASAADAFDAAGADSAAVADTAADRRDAGPLSDGPPPDTNVPPACSPAPDQHGFFASCSACPDPGECDTIDVNGSRRYACGCSGGCPCDLHCGSYTIAGTITITDICVR
jgi:hypothetical protein